MIKTALLKLILFMIIQEMFKDHKSAYNMVCSNLFLLY